MAAIHPLVGLGSGKLLTTLLGADDRSISGVQVRYFTAFRPFIRLLNGATGLLRSISAFGGRSLVGDLDREA